MFRTACPSCGAEVLYRSTIAAVAVCEYCQSTVLRNADEVKSIGKVGKVLEDYSPIQIGTTGVFANRAFTVLGRIQLRYDAGLWNEWYVSFDDGQQGWLADTSGQYMFTLPVDVSTDKAASKAKLDFETMRPEMRYDHAGRRFVVTDVRTAQCVGGQGELPFAVNNGWLAKVVDCRSGNRFLTLDFSDITLFKPNPVVYVGEAVELSAMQMQLLRDGETILASAGRLKGVSAVLDCPNCGNPLQYQAGVATQIVCKACASNVDCSGDKALVLAKHTAAAQYHATLDVGNSATIDGVKWTIVGLIEMEECDDADESWTEYLLYNAKCGFFWLVETRTGWSRVHVLNEIPESWSNDHAQMGGKRYRKLYADYDARATYAAGAFNWRVSVGDRVKVFEYENNGDVLCKEINAAEMVWSRSKKVPNQLIEQWFNKPKITSVAANSASGSGDLPDKSLSTMFTVALLLINLPIVFVGDSIFLGLIWMAIAIWLLQWPLPKDEA